MGSSGVDLVDLNRDGILDLVTANSSSDDISVLVGLGDGTFGAESRYPAPVSPTNVTSGDVNRDGWPDIIALSYTADSASVFTSNCGVSFADPYQVMVGEDPNRAATIDFDRDGWLDLITGDEHDYCSSVMFNRSPLDPWLLFWDDESLVWSGVGRAGRYNLYRGNVAELSDGSGDGMPDAGYGTCWNQADSDLTDTTFIETDTPAAEAGFYYLVTVVGPVGEEGAGRTWNCIPRLPAGLCDAE